MIYVEFKRSVYKRENASVITVNKEHVHPLLLSVYLYRYTYKVGHIIVVCEQVTNWRVHSVDGDMPCDGKGEYTRVEVCMSA